MMQQSTEQQAEMAKLVIESMGQFQALHVPSLEMVGDNGNVRRLVCAECQEDFPCLKQEIMFVVQGLAEFQKMIPGGNMMGALAKFNQLRGT